jgi:hypothetical protein
MAGFVGVVRFFLSSKVFMWGFLFRRRRGLWLISGLLHAEYDRWMDGWMDGCLLAWFTHAVGSVGMDGMVRWYGMDEGMKGFMY